MRPLDGPTQLTLAREANRAPSVHNVQPARWRFTPDNTVLLFEDTRRRLLVGDPTGYDNRLSLGAAFEGLHLALTRLGLGLREPEFPDCRTIDVAIPHALALVAQASIEPSRAPDPLTAYVSRRRTCRLKFRPADAEAARRLRQVCETLTDVVLVLGRPEIDDLAALNDQCGYEFLERPDYRAELYEWLRLSEDHPRWHRDGLTADCLGLSGLERRVAAIAFRPGAFEVLKAARLTRPLTADGAKTRSASAVLIFVGSQPEDPLRTGRRFYRIWLELCRAGFALCPMSALADSAQGRDYLQRHHRIPDGSRIVNVFRVGKAPSEGAPSSPRLPAEELLV